MKNEEIGTYVICESIIINPKLKVQKVGKQLIAKINGVTHIGNTAIIKKCVPIKTLSYNKKLINNNVSQDKTAKEIYSDIFGITSNHDKKLVYDPDNIWEQSIAMSTAKVETKKENKFKLTTNDNTGLI